MGAHSVAIVGLGGAGLGHLRYWPANGVRVAGICDVQPELLDRRSREFDLKGVYRTTDFADLLKGCDADCVAICTPDHLHAEQAVAAIKAGRNVQIEKPVASSRAEVRALVATAREAKVLVGLHYQLRFFWAYRRIKELISRGALGEVLAVEADYFHNLKIRTIGTSDWREREGTVQPVFAGVGGTHFIDLMRWFIGDEVEEVCTMGNRKAWSEYPADTHVTVVARFKNGAVGKSTVSIGTALPKQHPTKVIGTRAAVDDVFLFRDPNVARPEWLGSRLGTLSRGRLKGPIAEGLTWLLQKAPIRLERYPFSSYEHTESCVAVVGNFVKALDKEEPLEGSLDDAAKTFCVCDAVEESLKSRRVTQVQYELG